MASRHLQRALGTWGVMDLGPLTTGLFAGLIPLLVWEGLLKPARERRRLARGIAAEVSLIVQYLDDIYATNIEHPTHAPDRFRFPPSVFTANAGHIGDLSAAEDLVLFYAQLAVVENHAAGWNALIDRVRASPSPDPELRARDEQEDLERSRAVRLSTASAIGTGIRVLEQLRPMQFNTRIESVDQINRRLAHGEPSPRRPARG